MGKVLAACLALSLANACAPSDDARQEDALRGLSDGSLQPDTVSSDSSAPSDTRADASTGIVDETSLARDDRISPDTLGPQDARLSPAEADASLDVPTADVVTIEDAFDAAEARASSDGMIVDAPFAVDSSDASDGPGTVDGGAAPDGAMGGDAGALVCGPDPVGITPGVPAADTCDGMVPMITQSGHYPFTFTGAHADYNLGCTYNYPNRRDVVFGIQLASRKNVALTMTQTGSTSSTMALTTACASPPTTISCTALGTTLDPGTYYAIMETYSDADGALDVTITPAPSFDGVESCIAAGALAGQRCPLTPGQYNPSFASGSNSPPAASCESAPINTSVAPFRLAARSQVTVTRTRDPYWQASAAVGGVALRTDCGMTADASCLHFGGIFTKALDAGTYYMVTTSGMYYDARQTGPVEVIPVSTLIVEPIQPAATNVSCDARTALPLGKSDEGRIVGGPVDPSDPSRRLRYYSFDIDGAFDIMVTPGFASYDVDGSDFTLHVLGDCNSASSEFATASLIPIGGRAEVARNGGLPPGNYTLIISATEGSKYSFDRRL
jgi:hypothetical protein